MCFTDSAVSLLCAEMFVTRLSVENVIASLRRPREGECEEWKRSNVQKICSRIFEGNNKMVHYLKSKEDKCYFLDQAISRSDGNFIIMAVVFLRSTCSSSIFNREVSKRPAAIDHYIRYLTSKASHNVLMDFLTMTGRSDEAAVTKLKMCLSCNIESKIRQLKHCNQNFFSIVNYGSGQEVSDHWATLATQFVTLLEQQLPIEEDDKRLESLPTSEQNAKFLEIPRKSLLNLPLITTLCYCCLYHYDLPENCLASPLAIKKSYHLTEKQFTMTALVALSIRNKWQLVDTLFQPKSWLGLKKTKIPIKPEIIFQIVTKYGAPNYVSQKYLSMIEDVEKREKLAKESRK